MTSSPIENQEQKNEAKSYTSDFTIEHILNRAGTMSSGKVDRVVADCIENVVSVTPLPWLHCTRYCPPKIPRNQKRDLPQKRQLGRHPRIPFTNHQLAVLEEKFQQSPYLSSEEVTRLSHTLQLADIRVKIWFQNRRARERRERTTNTEACGKSPSSPKADTGSTSVYTYLPTQFLIPNTLGLYNNDSIQISHPAEKSSIKR